MCREIIVASPSGTGMAVEKGDKLGTRLRSGQIMQTYQDLMWTRQGWKKDTQKTVPVKTIIGMIEATEEENKRKSAKKKGEDRNIACDQSGRKGY